MSRFKTFSSNSTMGKNVNQILYDLNLDICELEMLYLNKIKNMYYQKWISDVNGLYVVHSKCIYDLCMMKEKVSYSSQYKNECEFFIRFFCTL